MTINLIDARRGLHNKCLELFADKKIAEQIYRYLCDGIEDCEEVDSVKHGQWIPGKEIAREFLAGNVIHVDYLNYCCSVCGAIVSERETMMYHFCPNCGARMGGEEND